MKSYVKEEHRERVRWIAEQKAQALRGQKSTTVYVEDNDLKGIIAEYAFGTTFGYTLRVNFDRRTDGGYDFLVGSPPGGKIFKLDVKGTGQPFGSLLVKRPEIKADLYVLVWVDPGRWAYEFSGWAWSFEVEEARKTKNFFTGANNYELRSDGLNAMSELVEIVNRNSAVPEFTY